MNKVTVHRLLNKKDKVTYTFGHESDNPDIPILILQDDSVEKAITKIALGIFNYHTARKEQAPSIHAIPYIWSKKEALRFEVSNIAINPWNFEKGDEGKKGDMTIKYNDETLFMKTTVNIVFINDVPDNLKAYYFPDRNIEWKPKFTFKEFIKESDALYSLWNIQQNEAKEHRTFLFSKVRFIGKIQMKSSLIDIFQNTHSSREVPFIQYIQDSAKILYKIWKKHSILTQLLQSWTLFDKLPKVEMMLAMIPLDRDNTYARATLDQVGNVAIQFQIDSRDKIEWSVIEKYTVKISTWFQQLLHLSVKLHVDSISGKGEFASQGISIQDVSKTIGRGVFIPLYHVIRVHEGVLYVAFKRSKNYRSQIDITDYISSNIKLGISLEEITKNLIDFGITQKDVLIWIEQYQTQTQMTEDMPKKKAISFTGCLFKIEKSPYGFRVSMDNVATLEELEYIYHWMRSSIKYIMNEFATKVKKPVAVAVAALPVPVTKAEPIAVAAESISDKKEPEEDLFGDEIDFSGGAGKKGQGTDRYFLSQLQQHDPGIFLDIPNYAKKCSSTNFRQPIVVSQAEKARIDADGYKNAYDDSVLYGSDQQHLNHYMCPRIWCPTSRIPLTEKQLEDNKGKCPGPHFEEPMKLYKNSYWDNSPKIPHHIGFHNKKTPTGLCLPCCMKNPMKESKKADCKAPEPSATNATKKQGEAKTATATAAPGQSQGVAETTEAVKEDGYIMGAVAPIPLDRYGAIPKDMHTYLLPKVPYQLCSKNITTNECYLRRGIIHGDDSFMNAVAIAMGMKTKKDLVAYILKILDPLTFITMGNGNVLTAFMPMEPIIPKENKTLVKKWLEWIKKFPKYARMISSGSGSMSQIMLSRELMIYTAYKNFIAYLKSNDTKNYEHVATVLLKEKIILLLWKRNGEEATLQCSTYNHVDDIFTAAKDKKVVMLLEDKEYYEPIELKQRGKAGVAMFTENGTLAQDIAEIARQCPVPYKMDALTYDREKLFVENMRSLVAWTELRLLNTASPFRLRCVILRQDLTIYGFLTRGNLLIRGPQEGILSHVLSELLNVIPTLLHVIYLEDIAGKNLEIADIIASDYRMYNEKINDIGCVLYSGTLGESSSSSNKNLLSDGILQIEPLNYSILPTIRTRTYDDLRKNEVELEGLDKKWFQIQNLVGNTLLKYYESLVVPLLKRSRKDRVRILMNTFQTLPDYAKDKLQMTLEEIPLEYGKEGLVQWIRSIGIEKRARIYTSSFVKSDKSEWVFSQAAVENGLPIEVLKPVKSVHANENFGESRVVDFQTSTTASTNTSVGPLPAMINKPVCKVENLPSKWNKTRSGSTWDKYKWYSFENYSSESVPQLFAWMHQVTNIPFSWKDVQDIRNREISGLIQDKETTVKVFEDPSLLKAWSVTFGKKYKDGADLWSAKLGSLSKKERMESWVDVLQKQGATIWPTDLDFKIIAELMNISILVIYRGKYGEGTAAAAKRGAVEDLYISSTFYHGMDWHTRPCIIFYRSIEKNKLVFSAVVYSVDDTFIHLTVDTMTKDVRALLEFHMKKKRRRHEESSSSTTSSK